MILRYMLIGMAIGAVTELVARILRLRLYRNAIYPALNILLVFGVIMGGLASASRLLGPLPTALIAGAIGLAYESANLTWLHWWSFQDEREATAAGRTAIVVLLSVLWAVVPFVTVQAEARLHRMSVISPPANKLDQLHEREQQLLRKLDELRQRLHDVETKLEQVRIRAQHVIDKQAAHQPGRKVAAPTPTS